MFSPFTPSFFLFSFCIILLFFSVFCSSSLFVFYFLWSRLRYVSIQSSFERFSYAFRLFPMSCPELQNCFGSLLSGLRSALCTWNHSWTFCPEWHSCYPPQIDLESVCDGRNLGNIESVCDGRGPGNLESVCDGEESGKPRVSILWEESGKPRVSMRWAESGKCGVSMQWEESGKSRVSMRNFLPTHGGIWKSGIVTKSSVSWDITPCSLLSFTGRYGRTCRLYNLIIKYRIEFAKDVYAFCLIPPLQRNTDWSENSLNSY
jgi:hypothetical protein